jgi:hypothetical protein
VRKFRSRGRLPIERIYNPTRKGRGLEGLQICSKKEGRQPQEEIPSFRRGSTSVDRQREKRVAAKDT